MFCRSLFVLFLLAIVLSVLFTDFDYLFGIFWPLHCLSYLQILITSLVSFGHCIVCPSIYGFWLPLWYVLAIVLSVLLFTDLITSLVSFGHCIVCPIYGFWLPLWYLLAIVLSVLFTDFDYLFGIDIDHLIFPFFVIYILNRKCYANISIGNG
jgi:hypothetical protein